MWNFVKDIIGLLVSIIMMWSGIKTIMEKSGFGCSGYEAVIIGLIHVICGGLLFYAIVYLFVMKILKK